MFSALCSSQRVHCSGLAQHSSTRPPLRSTCGRGPASSAQTSSQDRGASAAQRRHGDPVHHVPRLHEVTQQLLTHVWTNAGKHLRIISELCSQGGADEVRTGAALVQRRQLQQHDGAGCGRRSDPADPGPSGAQLLLFFTAFQRVSEEPNAGFRLHPSYTDRGDGDSGVKKHVFSTGVKLMVKHRNSLTEVVQLLAHEGTRDEKKGLEICFSAVILVL